MPQSRRRSSFDAMVMSMGPSIPQEPNSIPYTHSAPHLDEANNEPTTRSVDRVRTHAEVEASRSRSASLGEGYTMRVPMTNQEVNDQFPYLPKGKQR